MANELSGLTKPVVVLGALAVIVLVFGSILTTFSKDFRVTNSTVNVSFVVPENSTVLVGASGTYPFLQSITGCHNTTSKAQTFLISASNYTVLEGNTAGGFMNTIDELASGTGWENETVNCSISWLQGTATQRASDKFSSGLTVFATFMAVLVLAIVGGVIIRLFKKGDGGAV